jgi:hypothetical protein
MWMRGADFARLLIRATKCSPVVRCVSEMEEKPADPTQVGNFSQKKMLTFLASNTFWSRVILRPAIFHAPATRRSTSRRAPT